jgi:hypothetical protein
MKAVAESFNAHESAPEYTVHKNNDGTRFYLFNNVDSVWLPEASSPWEVGGGSETSRSNGLEGCWSLHPGIAFHTRLTNVPLPGPPPIWMPPIVCLLSIAASA